jgi:hypothetical protein
MRETTPIADRQHRRTEQEDDKKGKATPVTGRGGP